MEIQAHNVLAMVHLIMLSMWGGVVATEAVIEIYPFRRRELHAATIRFHYWIDLLVELPLVLAVIATGIALLLLTDPVTPLHLVKVGFGGAAVAINLFCIWNAAPTMGRCGAHRERCWRALRSASCAPEEPPHSDSVSPSSDWDERHRGWFSLKAITEFPRSVGMTTNPCSGAKAKSVRLIPTSRVSMSTSRSPVGVTRRSRPLKSETR